LRTLDLDSREMLAITTRWGVRADGLHELYLQTGASLSRQKFAEEMLRHFGDPSTPFMAKRKVEVGVVYCLKARPSAPLVPLSGPSGSSGSSASSADEVTRESVM